MAVILGLSLVVLVPLHILLGRPSWTPRRFHLLMRRAFRVTVTRHGAAPASAPVLYVANHVSWVDIFVLGSLFPAAFVAKSEVANWPLIGRLARLQPAAFVNRGDRRGAASQAGALADAIARHGAVILFAEGTSSDGAGVLPFKSALFQALGDVPGLLVQPVSLRYDVAGTGAGRVAWIGDMTLAPHLASVAGERSVRAAVMLHTPFAPGSDGRKVLARRCETAVAAGHTALAGLLSG